MKVICKTVAGASAEVEVEPTDTLAELKVPIERFGLEFDLLNGLSHASFWSSQF